RGFSLRRSATQRTAWRCRDFHPASDQCDGEIQRMFHSAARHIAVRIAEYVVGADRREGCRNTSGPRSSLRGGGNCPPSTAAFEREPERRCPRIAAGPEASCRLSTSRSCHKRDSSTRQSVPSLHCPRRNLHLPA